MGIESINNSFPDPYKTRKLDHLDLAEDCEPDKISPETLAIIKDLVNNEINEQNLPKTLPEDAQYVSWTDFKIEEMDLSQVILLKQKIKRLREYLNIYKQ